MITDPLPAPTGSVPGAAEWATIAAGAPQMATTMSRYLTQVATFLAPRSVEVADNALRQLARYLLAHEPDVVTMAGTTAPG